MHFTAVGVDITVINNAGVYVKRRDEFTVLFEILLLSEVAFQSVATEKAFDINFIYRLYVSAEWIVSHKPLLECFS